MSLRTTWVQIAACAFASFAALAFHPRASAEDGERGPAPSKECVKVSSEARYSAYAYDHIVTLDNTCDTAMRCEVSSDVNPTPASVDLAKGETKSVLTYRGSPASEFKAQVVCRAQ